MKTLNMYFHFFFLLLTFFMATEVTAQAPKTKVRGKVIDAETGEPLPFVSIAFVGTTVGVITDFDGAYYVETRNASDTIIASYLGYKPVKKAVKKFHFQNINFELQPDNITLDEIVVYPGENPAHRILRNIIKNKKMNNPVKLNSYQYEVYNKMELDVNNIDSTFKQKKVFNQFQFIFDYVDTCVITGKPYLPVFISETLSDYYYQKRPRKVKEIIKASNISGVRNESVIQYTGQMYIDINVYNNFIGAFDKEFVSPIADFGLLTYKYYLVDSAFLDNQWCYLISFKPRRRQEFTFTGEFWVHDTTFAIKKIKARISDDVNINFIDDLIVTHEFSMVQDSIWILTKDELFVDFNITDRSTGFFGRKTTSYKNIIVGKEYDEEFFASTAPQESIVLKDADDKDTAFWNNARHGELSSKEEAIYSMVDSIKRVPVFNTIADFVMLFVSGYYVTGPIELGPYYTFASFNEIEGWRIKLGGRTSNDFSTRVMYNGHIAYGLRDKKVKYGAGVLYMFSKTPRTSAGFSLSHDIEQLGQSQNAFMEDNILASVLKRRPKYKLSLVDEVKGFYEKEWFLGFSNTITVKHRSIYATDSIEFTEVETGIERNRLTAAEVTLNTRLAYNEKFVHGEFERISLGSEYPILNFNFTAGIKNIFHSDYEYYKADFSIQHHFDINPFGQFKYTIEGGKIWGTLPYPLLRLHEGNETYAFDDYAFNMMNYYEFVSDMYASFYAEHHFNGMFLNKVPLFRRLKLREVVHVKALIGNLSDKNNAQLKDGEYVTNKNIMQFPTSLTGLKQPYIEVGLGVENILKIFRVDAVWRLSYLDRPNIQVFSPRAKIQIIF